MLFNLFAAMGNLIATPGIQKPIIPLRINMGFSGASAVLVISREPRNSKGYTYVFNYAQLK